MGKKVFDRDNWVVLLDGRMMIDQLMDREGVHPEFESLWGRIRRKKSTSSIPAALLSK